MAQELKGSAFNILFTASFFASFVYVMLHFGSARSALGD